MLCRSSVFYHQPVPETTFCRKKRYIVLSLLEFSNILKTLIKDNGDVCFHASSGRKGMCPQNWPPGSKNDPDWIRAASVYPRNSHWEGIPFLSYCSLISILFRKHFRINFYYRKPRQWSMSLLRTFAMLDPVKHKISDYGTPLGIAIRDF